MPSRRGRLRILEYLHAVVLYLLLPVLLLLVALCAWLYFNQGRMVFQAQHVTVTPDLVHQATALGAEELRLEGADGVTLHGFFWPGEGTAPRQTIIYFGGNAENVGWNLGRHATLHRQGWNLALVYYRGYGLSTGSPSARGLLADSLPVYDQIVARADVDRQHIVAWGRSIGTGVAAHLARHRPVAGAVLVSPYTRLSDVAAHHFPWLPVRLLFRHEIDTISHASEMQVPALILHGDVDRIIPYEQALTLAAAWQPPPTLCTIEGRGHNDLDEEPEFEQAVLAFLDSLN